MEDDFRVSSFSSWMDKVPFTGMGTQEEKQLGVP